MKKITNQKTIIAIAIIVSLISLNQCRETKHESIKDPYADVQINPLFSVDPPLATEINISELTTPSDFGNLLYEANLPKEKIKSDVIAVMINDDNKIVLHDDGKNGDKSRGDGIYSTIMNVSTDSLKMMLNEQTLSAKRMINDRQELFQFVGRSELPIDKSMLASLKKVSDKATIDFRNRFSIIPSVILPLLIPVSESLKHTSLMVTDPSVINDQKRTFNPFTNSGTAGGAWTFGKLMSDMAITSGHTPEDFVLSWLNTWTSTQTVNGDAINSRNINIILNAWHTLCGGAAAPLDVKKAPFKLLAIVNRFDLRSGGAYGGGNAGEGRFVFCATNAQCQPLTPGFFVIFEYGVNKRTCSDIHAYAQKWVDLNSLSFPSSSYNDSLQSITDQFALSGTNPSKPNGNSLDQLRTNDFGLGELPWQLREFNISKSTKLLENVTTKREPQIPFNGKSGSNTASIQAFGDFVNNNMRNIINDKMELSDSILVSGVRIPFIAGKAHTLDPSFFHWDAIVSIGPGHIDNDTARFHISLNTCSGCHGGETNTGTFTHVGLPTSPNGPPHLSPFLTGNPAFSSLPFLVSDRANRPSAGTPIQWPFNDLERRGRDLVDFTTTNCLPSFHVPILVNQHIPFNVPIELTKRLTFSPVTMTD